METRQIRQLLLLCSFLLGIHKGYIALWQDKDPDPTAIYPYRAEYLPPEDYQALQDGIRINSKRDLNYLLEDYLS